MPSKEEYKKYDKQMMQKDSPVPPRSDKEMRKAAAKKKLQKKSKY